MATTLLPETAAEEEHPETQQDPPAFVLTERFPEKLRLSKGAAVLIILLSVCAWRMCSRPLYHTDLWGHLSYGKLIWNSGALPATEPFLPLAKGVPLVDTAWLTQVLGYGVMRVGGVPGMQFLFGLAITSILALVARELYQRTFRVGTALLGIAVCLFVSLQQWVIGWGDMPALIRPQVAGLVCYAWLFVRLSRQRPQPGDWYLIPAVTALWANLHGSFVLAPLLVLAWGIGRAIDTWRHTGNLVLALRSRSAWHWILIAELSAVAALVNPYGLGLYLEVFNFANASNLKDLLDWEPLSMAQSQGRIAAYVTMALVVVYRLSPRRITTSEAIVLLGLAFWSWTSSRMLCWWAIPAGYYLALNWRAYRRVAKQQPLVALAPERRGLWTVIAVALCWVAYGLTPLGVKTIHKKEPELKRALGTDTPVGAVAYLNKKPPRGQVFNSYEWGDFLGWAGPAGMKLFVNSHPHLIPEEVWTHYMTVSRAYSGWENVLERYGVNTIVLDHRQHIGLTSQLRSDDKWNEVYVDGVASIFQRKNPL